MIRPSSIPLTRVTHAYPCECSGGFPAALTSSTICHWRNSSIVLACSPPAFGCLDRPPRRSSADGAVVGNSVETAEAPGIVLGGLTDMVGMKGCPTHGVLRVFDPGGSVGAHE